jgi:hypothetical protein
MHIYDLPYQCQMNDGQASNLEKTGDHLPWWTIDIVPCQINKPLKRCCVQMQMNGADAMIQHAGLNVVSLLTYQSFYICFKTYIPHVLLMKGIVAEK